MTDPIVLGDGDDWTIQRGDTNVLQLEWVEPDDAETPIDLSAVSHALRVQVKRDPDDPLSCAVLQAGSYFASEYAITGTSSNIAEMTIRPYRTRDLEAGRYKVDAELTRALSLITSAGSIAVTAGGSTITGTGVDFSAVNVGDLLVPAGASGNDRPVVITSVDASAGTLETDYPGFVTESGISFSIYAGRVDTAFSRDAVISDDRTR